MSKFPVELGDTQGIIDAVNYTLSGPQGLGQSFSGFSASTPGFVTGNYRIPYGSSTGVKLTVAPIALSTAEMLDGATYKFTFAAAEPAPPFGLGNNIEVAGVADSWYNDTYTAIGVIECTTTYVIVRGSGTFYPIVAPSTGGTIKRETSGGFLSTECNAKVTVTSATDRVFISGQINNLITVTATTPSTLTYQVLINRYKGYPNANPTNPGYVFDLDGVNATIAYRDYSFNVDPTGPTNYPLLPETDTIFASVIDSPGPGYYWYIMEILFQPTGGDVQPEYSETFYRGFTAQVVKQ
jgi:hypothetical protein